MSLHLNKTGLRALGIAESFMRTRPCSILAGVVMRADLRVDGLGYARATVGGDDATGAVLEIFRELERFLQVPGIDFSFILRQKRMTIGEKDFYLDLLFYHRSLRRLVAIELKMGSFMPPTRARWNST
jgi:hypothetical protein